MYRIGLIGGMGSGKSYLRKLFQKQGISTLDLDELGHKALERPDVQAALTQEFGEELCESGTVNRKLLASRAFMSEDATERLNEIMSPALCEELERELIQLERAGERAVVLEISAYTGPGGSYDVPLNCLVAVVADQELRLKRLIEKGFERSDALNRMARQVTDDKRSSWADFCLTNEGSLEDLESQFQALLPAIQARISEN